MATTVEYTFTLMPCSTKRLEINAACINANSPIPGKRDRFEGVSKVSRNVARFLEASKGMDAMVIQAGVWTLTDNYSRYDVINHLVTRDRWGNTSHPITHTHCDKAKTILDRLGISHRLWHSSVPYEKKTQKYENGTYVGEFRYGDQHGRGKYTWAGGTSYDGDWKNGEMHGHGIYTFKDGGKYVGEFEADRESGGWYHFPNGTMQWCLRDNQGKWVNNAAIPAKEQQNIAPSNLSPISSFPGRSTPAVAPAPPVHKESSLIRDEIYEAARKGNLKMVREQIRRNPKLVLTKNYNGWTPLHFAADSGQQAIVELLLANKADVDAKTNEGKTPLHFAALNGRTEVVELLLDNKADVNVKDNGGECLVLK